MLYSQSEVHLWPSLQVTSISASTPILGILLGKEVAAKLEPIKAKHGVPFMHWFGIKCDYNVIVIDWAHPLRTHSTSATRSFPSRQSFLLSNSCVTIEIIANMWTPWL